MSRALVGGTDQVQLPTDSTGKRAGFVKTAIGGSGTELYVPASVLTDDAGNTIDALASTPAGTERGLAVRQIGTHGVNYDSPTAGTASWTSATALNTALTVSVLNQSNVRITFTNTSTMTAGQFVFEASDDSGTTWWPIDVIRHGGAGGPWAEQSYSIPTANQTQVWACDVSGWTNLRVRLATVIAGTGTATLRISPDAAPMVQRTLAALDAGRSPTYIGSSATDVAGVVTASTTTWFLNLFHAATVLTTIQVLRVELQVRVAAVGPGTTDRWALVSTSTVGTGTIVTPTATNAGRRSTTATLQRGTFSVAPTLVSTYWSAPVASLTARGDPYVIYNYDRTSGEEPLTIRGGQAEGIGIASVVGGSALTTAPTIWWNIYYRELGT